MVKGNKEETKSYQKRNNMEKGREERQEIVKKKSKEKGHRTKIA